MNRREFFHLTAVGGIIASFPTVSLCRESIYLMPSGGDDTEAINTALKASARIGVPVILSQGAYTVTDSIIVLVGAKLISQGESSLITFTGQSTHAAITIHRPCHSDAVKNLHVKDSRSLVPMTAMIG
ncbi:hypothetical protein EYC98_13150 [Halieaceae bacterium IMCC14734]|uniref:Pectate lyase superfamily protein domain-containing protein n=1 Tax=Candidatus Litorirhabdus singularis TaxID=2518993 RepID=A0ABT3THJ3_9GAMM|nr:hypothetical protein [Candidatus Litorirhabdus singularis]MCX2981806.1 hypothetical protein [Candidatus Litorirhabdus singularis]